MCRNMAPLLQVEREKEIQTLKWSLWVEKWTLKWSLWVRKCSHFAGCVAEFHFKHSNHRTLDSRLFLIRTENEKGTEEEFH